MYGDRINQYLNLIVLFVYVYQGKCTQIIALSGDNDLLLHVFNQTWSRPYHSPNMTMAGFT